MRSLLKADTSVLVYVSDGYDLDYYTVKLDNYDMFMLIGRAYAIGYENFEIGMSVLDNHNSDILDKEVILAKVHEGNITLNWDYVHKADKSVWTVGRPIDL